MPALRVQIPQVSKSGAPMIMWERALDGFCEWYLANVFAEVAQARQSHTDAVIMTVAEENNVLPPTVDKLKVS